MQIGLSGLLAAQRQIATTSHNISNANVDGYSRQRVEQGTRPPQTLGGLGIGQGTMVRDVERLYDGFLGTQMREVGAEHQRLTVFHRMSSYVDDILADPAGGITPALQGFFSAVQDVADDPGASTARIALLDQGEALSARFQAIEGQFDALAADTGKRIGETVGEINALAQSLHAANEDIINAASASSSGAAPDLLDQRDRLLDQLSERIGIQVLEHARGDVSVMVAGGQPLVTQSGAQQLGTSRDPADPQRLRISYDNGSVSVDINGKLSGGSLGGLLDFQGGMLDTARGELGRIAIGIAETFNAQQARGMDLNGALGGDLFKVAGPRVQANSGNTGNASVGAAITDLGALQSGDYTLSYDGANWTLAGAEGGSVSGAGPSLALDGFEVSVGGAPAAGDRFLIQPTRLGAASLEVAISDPNQVAAAAAVRSGSDLGNAGSAGISAGEVLDASDPNLQQAVELVFASPPSSFDIVEAGSGAVLAAGQAYTPGADIDFNGWRMQISGSPAAGDRFTVESNAGGSADNRNMLAMAELQNTGVLDGGSSSFQDAYSATVGLVGSQTRSADINRQAQESLVTTLNARRESISGVNLDEEAANLVRFQQAYQAAARVVGVADDLFNSLLNAI